MSAGARYTFLGNKAPTHHLNQKLTKCRPHSTAILEPLINSPLIASRVADLEKREVSNGTSAPSVTAGEWQRRRVKYRRIVNMTVSRTRLNLSAQMMKIRILRFLGPRGVESFFRNGSHFRMMQGPEIFSSTRSV